MSFFSVNKDTKSIYQNYHSVYEMTTDSGTS